VSAGQDELTAVSPERGRTRRSWSREEKRRIIAEAFRPGASAADVARGYGLNANQLFNWRRALAVPAKNRGSRIVKASMTALASAAGILPVGIIVAAGDDGQAVAAEPVADVTPLNQGTTRFSRGECAELIEIHLVCGTCLRVDAFVDEHALRRVLSAVKAS
jgi:transposase